MHDPVHDVFPFLKLPLFQPDSHSAKNKRESYAWSYDYVQGTQRDAAYRGAVTPWFFWWAMKDSNLQPPDEPDKTAAVRRFFEGSAD